MKPSAFILLALLAAASGCTLIAGMSDNDFRDDTGSVDEDALDVTGSSTDDELSSDAEIGSLNGSGTDDNAIDTGSQTQSDAGSITDDTQTAANDSESESGCDHDTDCDDKVDCTVDICRNGVCERAPDDALCDDGNDCTKDVCDPFEGCRNPNLGDFTPCELVTTPDVSYDICSSGRCISPGTCGTADCNAPGPHVPMPGPHIDLVRNTSVPGQPVVEDPITKLLWQGCPYGKGGDDCAEGDVKRIPFEDALTYCDELDWGGYTDWHLPDPYELASLFNEKDETGFVASLMVDGEAFPNDFSVFWSTAASAFNPEHQWVVGYFWNMLIPAMVITQQARGDKVANNPVRCVRGAASGVSSEPRYERKEQTTENWVVVDRITSRMWQGCAAGQSGSACTSGRADEMSHKDAKKYCFDSGWAGFADWRLPTLKELLILVDFQREGVMIDFDAFPSTPGSWFWSETSINVDAALSVSFEPFIDLDALVSLRGLDSTPGGAYIRCIRDL